MSINPELVLTLQTHPANANALSPNESKEAWMKYYANIINRNLSFFELQKK